MAGYHVSEERLEAAGPQIVGAAQTLAEGGAISDAEAKSAPGRITPCPALDAALANADLVVEAIVENAEAKRPLYDKVAMYAPAHAVLASNTSFLDIFPHLPATFENRAFIVHWYTPPYIIDLVDVVPAPLTPEELTLRMTDFLRSLDKTPVVLKRFVPGYLANRIQFAIENEAFRLVEEGIADVESVDE